MNRRNAVAALFALAITSHSLTSRAQQPGKVRRIGFLAVRSRSTAFNSDFYFGAFVQEMRNLGYVEGTTLVIEWRFADGKYERLPDLASELARLKLEVIVTGGVAATEALRRATNSIPIVTAVVADPVGGGFAASMARPGGNITGLSPMSVDLSAKRFELLKLIMPALSRVAVLVNSSNSIHSAEVKSLQTATKKLGVEVMSVDARTPEEIDRGFAAMRRERADAVIIPGDAFFLGQRRQIAELAVQSRLPSMFELREQMGASGMMSYGPNFVEFYRRSAKYVDKILKGAKPSDLPFEQPMNIHLAINRKTAKAFGLTIPRELLLRADEVIE